MDLHRCRFRIFYVNGGASASSGSRFNLEFCFSMHRRLLLVVWEREKGIFRAIAIKTTGICSADEPLSCRTSSCHRVGGFNLFRQEFSRQERVKLLISYEAVEP